LQLPQSREEIAAYLRDEPSNFDIEDALEHGKLRRRHRRTTEPWRAASNVAQAGFQSAP
jgi:hypothetical protein